MNDTLIRIQRALDLIEARLFGELPLADIARAAAWSQYHFHRLFTALTGLPPAQYIRKRRLSEMCRRLAETDEALVDIALACGFESQATFTRAFTQFIGVSPGRFRKACVHSAAHTYLSLDLAALVARQERKLMEPRIMRKPLFQVVGMAGQFTPATNTRIPELWMRFAPQMYAVPHRRGEHTFGVCIDADPSTVNEAGFTYLACVEVERVERVPDGMIAVTIPANTYAVFTHSGHIARISDTVKQVWGEWLPASGRRHIAAPDFELYDERWDPTTGMGDVDIYVPIADS